MSISGVFKLILFCSSIFLMSSCCGLLDSLRIYDSSLSGKTYHFDLSIHELANRLNKVSSEYYIQNGGYSQIQNLGKIEPCKSPKEYSEWTICFNEQENAYQRCGQGFGSVYDEKEGKQVDDSYQTCITELQLIDLKKIKAVDSLKMDNNFGTMILKGDQRTSRLDTPYGVQVLKEKCLSKKKQEARAIREFETNIIQKIRSHQ